MNDFSIIRTLIREILLEKIVRRGDFFHVMIKKRFGKKRRIRRNKSGDPMMKTAGKHRSYKKARNHMAAIEIGKAGG